MKQRPHDKQTTNDKKTKKLNVIIQFNKKSKRTNHSQLGYENNMSEVLKYARNLIKILNLTTEV